MDADFKLLMIRPAVGFIMLDGGENALQFPTDEHGEDGRRSLIRSAGATVIRLGGNGQTQNILIIIHSLNDSAQQKKKTGILRGRITGLQQVFPFVSGDGPVVVLAAAIHPFKGFFVQQADHIILPGNLLHDLHGELIIICRNIGRGENTCQLMLSRGCFVMLCLCHDAQLPELFIQLLHKGCNPGLDGAEVMV